MDEFFDPFKSSPSDEGPGKSSSDESLEVAGGNFSSDSSQYHFQHQTTLLSQDTQSPTNPSDDRHNKTTTFSRSTYTRSSTYPLRPSTDNDPDTHVTQLFEPDPYPSAIQQSYTYSTKTDDTWQQNHEKSWAQSPVAKSFKKEDMSPMMKTMPSTPFSSPPPKKRRFIASSNAVTEQSSETISKHNHVFRSPAGNPWYLSSVRLNSDSFLMLISLYIFMILLGFLFLSKCSN